MSSSNRRLASLLFVVLGTVGLVGCGTGQGSASNYDELEDAFLEQCEETRAADAEVAGAEAVPDDFCRCAFDALREDVPFDDLMAVDDELSEEPGPLPEEITAAYASCSEPA